jgi:hypothetical protein
MANLKVSYEVRTLYISYRKSVRNLNKLQRTAAKQWFYSFVIESWDFRSLTMCNVWRIMQGNYRYCEDGSDSIVLLY